MDLDMSKVGAEAATTAPADEFNLFAPPAITAEQAQNQASKVIVPVTVKPAIMQKAEGFAHEATAMDVNSPEFNNAVENIMKLGDSEIRKSAEVSNRMLKRPAMKENSLTPQGKVGATLTDLRNVVVELDPNRADLSLAKKFLKFMPGGNSVDRYFQKYRSAESQLNDIIKALNSGQDELRKDNASIEAEQVNLWNAMNEITKYSELTQMIDDALVAKVAELRAANRIDEASKVETELLFAVRQRHTDLLTQKAVAVQGYMALGLVHKNNMELIKGVDRAQNTTLAALRTAIIVSQALGQQKLVLNQITAVNQVTSDILVGTSEQLKMQAAEIQNQASSAMVSVEALKTAFNNVYETMDAIDTFRAQANSSMLQTIGTLQGELERSKTHLERANTGQQDRKTISY